MVPVNLLRKVGMGAVAAVALISTINTAEAGAIRGDAGFTGSTLAANDDGSTGLIALGFTVDFFGLSFSSAYVNNNGNITFDSALSTFTPFDLTSTGSEIIAPFFADVDTSSAGSLVTYGTSTIGGHAAFGVNWVDVDYFSSSTSHTSRNSFQLVLIDRSDIAVGDFDIEFNFDKIEWEAGTASGSDSSGLGGSSARVGFSNGTGAAGSFFELAGSAVNGAFLDGGPAMTALILNELLSDESFGSGGSPILGRYLFRARGGDISTPNDPPTGIPAPAALALFGFGLAGIGFMQRRRKQRAV